MQEKEKAMKSTTTITENHPVPPFRDFEPVLYVKSLCPWCWRAKAELKRLGVRYREVNVSRDEAAFAEMKRVSGQAFVPTLRVGDAVLADFGPEELKPFLQKIGLVR